jgi:hypothetical protein
MNKNRRRLISACLAGALVMFGMALPTPTRAAVVLNTSAPFTALIGIPCAPDIAFVTGDLHALITQEVDSDGGVHLKSHFQPQGVSGVGLLTGAKYQATGVTQEHTNIHSSLAFEDTFVNNFRIIGQGPGNNLLVHTTIHITVDANGVVTATVLNSSVDCQ